MHINFFTIISLLIFSNDLFAQQNKVYEPSSKSLNTKSYRIKGKLRQRTTLGTYDFQGNKTVLAGEESYSMIDGDVELGYGMGKQVDLLLDMKIRSISSTSSNAAATISSSNSGLESYSGTFKYTFDRNKKFEFAVDFNYRQTTYQQKFYTSNAQIPDGEIVLGDAGKEFSFGFHTSYQRKKSHYLSSLIRYRVPANDLSHELVYRLESAWLWKSVGFLAGVEGIKSFNTDNFSSNPEDKLIQPTGASAAFNSVNREHLTPFIGLNWGFKQWRLELEAGQTMSGVSTDHLRYMSAGFVYMTSGITDETVKITSFKEYIIDATVLKISPRGRFIKIDQGFSSDVEKGMRFDIFQTDYFGKNVLVASGVAFEIKADSTIIKILKKYSKIPIKKGFAGRGY